MSKVKTVGRPFQPHKDPEELSLASGLPPLPAPQGTQRILTSISSPPDDPGLHPNNEAPHGAQGDLKFKLSTGPSSSSRTVLLPIWACPVSIQESSTVGGAGFRLLVQLVGVNHSLPPLHGTKAVAVNGTQQL